MPRILKSAAALLSAVTPLLAAGIAPVGAQDVDMAQIGAVPGGVSTVLQNGNRNDASVNQLAVQSGLAPGQNQALIVQSGDDNRAAIGQEGSANSANIAQNGSGNEGAILQMNSGNAAELQQSGNGLSIKIEQYGAAIPGSAPIMITQGN